MMQLYYSPGACSLAPHILLEELDIPFEPMQVSIADGEHETAAFRAVNPKARVPALVVESQVLTEAPALLAYIAGQRPEAGLIPPTGSVAYGHCFEFLAFLSSSLHIAYAQLWRPQRFLSEDSPARDTLTAEAKPRIQRFNDEIEQRLTDEWVLGAQYSIADPYLFPFYRWGVRIGLAMERDYPRWTAWKDRMAKRSAVIRAVEREGIGFDWSPV